MAEGRIMRSQKCSRIALRFAMYRAMAMVALMIALFSSAAPGQCPVTDPATYPTTPLIYPMTSDRFAVQYKLGSGNWTNAQVYISYYGGTTSSPQLSYSRYSAEISMSFASVPAAANAQ